MTDNNQFLSQEEIDALLRGNLEDSSSADESSAQDNPSIDDLLNSLEQDALGEIGNITFGSAATALSTLLGRKVEITTPKVSLVARQNLQDEFPIPHVAVHVKFVEGFQGINLLVIKSTDAKVIADLMLGGDGTNTDGELNEIHISAVQEAMNQMMGSAATSMSTIFNRLVNISPPGVDILDVASGEGINRLPDEDVMIKVSFRLAIGDLVDSSIMQLLPVSFAKEMVAGLMGGSPSETGTVQPPEQQESAAPAAGETFRDQSQGGPEMPKAGQQPAYQQPFTQPPYQQPFYQQPADYMQAPGMQPPPYQPQTFQRIVNVQPVQYAAFGDTPGMQAAEPNLNLLLDIPLKVTVELGRTKKQIREILELTQGSIIELDKLAGEPVDILVNNKLIAKGEVVVIDENFGVRVTDIVSQAERFQKIQ